MNKKLKYVINTIEHYDVALKILHKSLVDDGVDPDDIIYIYSGAKKLEIKKNSENILCVYIPDNLYEYSSIIGIVYLILDDKTKKYLNDYNYLFLHDTCKALKGFKDKSLVMNSFLYPTEKFHIYWAHTSGRHNIGIFSAIAVLKAYRQCLKPILNGQTKFNKEYAIKMEWDTVPESFRNINLPQRFPNNQEGIVLLPNYTKSTLYSKDKPRSIAYLTVLNLVKYYFGVGAIRPGDFASGHPQSVV
jgi:hypothetical protein